MKRSLPLLLAGLATMVSSGTVLAQAQTRTPPVGYLATNLVPSPNGTTRGITTLSCPLHAAAIYQGAVSVVSGNTLTLTGAALPDVTTTPYVIHINNAANPAAVGWTFPITSATATTVSANPSGFQLSTILAANDQVLIYPTNTLASIFGATNSTVKLQGAASASAADLVYLWNGTAWVGYYYRPGTGWLQIGDSTNTVQNNTLIMPDRAMLVARISTNLLAASDVVITGTLPQNKQTTTFLAPGLTFVSNPLPTPITLAQLGLSSNAGWLDNGNAGDADVVCIFQGTNWQTYFHIQNYGWVLDSDPTYAVQDGLSIPPTSGLLVARQSSASLPALQVPLNYTAN